MPIGGLATALYGLETGKPYVFINKLIVRGDESKQSNKLEADPILDVTMTMFSYVLEGPTNGPTHDVER